MEADAMSEYLHKQRFTVVVEHYGAEPLSSEAIFLAVQDAVAPGGRLNEIGANEIIYINATASPRVEDRA
jgi:hypothetical protein